MTKVPADRLKALNRVRALMAKAEQTTEHEANALMDKVSQIMDRWDIDEDELGDIYAGPITDHPIDLEMPDEIATAFLWLVKRAADIYGVKSVRHSVQRPRMVTIRSTTDQWVALSPLIQWMRTELAMTLSVIEVSLLTSVSDFIHGWSSAVAQRLDALHPRVYVQPERTEAPSFADDEEAEEEVSRSDPIRVGRDAELGRSLATSIPIPLVELP
jgi:hypothetical protein